MRGSRSTRRARQRETLQILGWFLLVGLGFGLLWLGFWLSKENGQSSQTSLDRASVGRPSLTETKVPSDPARPTMTAAPTGTPVPLPTATSTPIPTATSKPVLDPPTPTPHIVAGADGVNVRTGPDTSFEKLGYLDPGDQAGLITSDGEWWEIWYDGVEAWVYGPLVTAVNVDQTGAAAPAPAPEVEPAADEAAGWADEVLQLINQMRTENGLPPYTSNDALESAAQVHALDSAERENLTHTGSDGSSPSTRVQRAGYKAVGVSEITVTGNSPQWAVNWWMDETPPDDPHRSAILSTDYTDIGLAVVRAGDTHYFIAVIAQPK